MKKNIMFFYKSSYGELNVGLPLVIELKKADKALKLFFVYHDSKSYNNLPDFYKKIIEDNFELILLTQNNIMKVHLKYFLDKNILFTCHLGHNFFTNILSCFWFFSRVVFFLHAYSIESEQIDIGRLKSLRSNPLTYSGYHHEPIFIANSKKDKKPWQSIGFNSENIVIAGFLGYKDEWINRLIDNTDTIDELIIKKQQFKKVVFIPMRNHHPKYLTQKNFNYLCDSISEFVKTFPEYLFIIKPHPRQNDMYDLEHLSYNVDNLIVTDVSTLLVSSISDIVVSFWSSAIVDAISVKVPVIEFHKHEVYHTQLIERESGLVSIFHDLSLCPFYERKEDVIELLFNSNNWNSIAEIQQENFGKLFPNDYQNFSNEFFKRIEKTKFRSSYFLDIFSIFSKIPKRILSKI